jgi:hypothetical protein
MGVVVVAGATLKCSHGGQLKLSTGDSRLEVDGSGAVTSGMESGLAFAPGAPGVIAPCPITTPAGAPSPCSSTAPATKGTSSKLYVGEMPVLLDDAGGQTINAVSPGTWSVADAGQSKLEAG